MGEQRLTEVQSSIAAEEKPPPLSQATVPSKPPEPASTPPEAQAPPQPVTAQEPESGSEPVSAQGPEATPEPPLDDVEVIAPGERLNPASGRTWSQSKDDLFGLAGEVHPDDEADHGLEICTEDLPWLNPGDSIISPRRGPCRIKRVEDEARQVVAKDENNQLIVLSFRELLAEFQFDDGN